MKIFPADTLKAGICTAGIFYPFYFCNNTKQPQGVEGTSLSCQEETLLHLFILVWLCLASKRQKHKYRGQWCVQGQVPGVVERTCGLRSH